MVRRAASRLVGPAVALALLVALTGCGKLAAGQGAGTGAPPLGSAGAGPAATASTAPADDSSALDAISQDLDSASTANTEAGSNAAAGDQAATTGDEP